MKINADERNFETIEQITDDMITTIASWSDDKQNDIAEGYGVANIINDWYYDYELTDDESEEIKEAVIEWFAE